MWRASWRCDCEGETWVGERPNAGIERARKAIGDITREEPQTCPWAAYRDPFVVEVLTAYMAWESGQVSLVLGDDPPSAIVDGLLHYHSTLQRIRVVDAETERKNRG